MRYAAGAADGEVAMTGSLGGDRGQVERLRWWVARGMHSSDEVTPALRRFYAGAPVVFNVVMLRVLSLCLFVWWQAWDLVVLSVAGLLLWAAAMWLAGQAMLAANNVVVYAEMAVNALVTLAVLGWAFGSQAWLVVLMVMAFLLPWSWRLRGLLGVGMGVLFLACWIAVGANGPASNVAYPGLPAAGTVNLTVALVTIALFIAYPTWLAERAELALAAEHARSERLLLTVLPEPIATRLKEHEAIIADRFDSASVLFADIVDFTPLAQRLPPEDVVALLDGVFSRLDALVDQHGLEKIKTIGDAYMVAAGIPAPRDDHLHALARFAVAARDAFRDPLPGQPAIQLRIGLHTGPVVAGVIGRRRFLYDLWGDTVNTAARLESHGVPGHIHLNDDTAAQLVGDFELTERGVIEIKGKGPMHTWLLTT
jgi:class 3 adenylate cyclase